METADAWPYIRSLESDRILEHLLAGAHDVLHYEMDPPSGVIPGGTILHLSCNTTSIPHIAYLAQRVMQAIGIEFVSMGGPENCCGAFQWSTGMDKMGHQVGNLTLGAFRRLKPVKVVSTCPDCDTLFSLYMTRQHTFRQANIIEVLTDNIDALTALLVNPVDRTVVVHDHDENEARRSDSAGLTEILRRIPGLRIIPAEHATGLGNHCLMKTGRFDCTVYEPLVREMVQEACELGADTLVMPYHGCYRNHCKRQLEYDVEVFHYLSLLAESIGIEYEEKFKAIRMLDDIDSAVDALEDVGRRHGYTRDEVRHALESKVYV